MDVVKCYACSLWADPTQWRWLGGRQTRATDDTWRFVARTRHLLTSLLQVQVATDNVPLCPSFIFKILVPIVTETRVGCLVTDFGVGCPKLIAKI